MPDATERFEDRQYVQRVSARRAWDVINCEHEEQVIAKVAGAWGVAEGTSHPLDSRLIAGPPEVRPVGPYGRLWVYSLPYESTDNGAIPGNPLDLPPDILWEPGNAAEPIDRDVFNNPIINSAGDAPSTPLTEEFPTMQLSVTRWEQTYDVQKYFAYRNRVNNDTLNIFNKWIVLPGQCRVVGYFPAQSFPLDAPYVQVTYRFEFQEGEKQDDDGLWDGFKRRFLDQGRMGWYGSGANAKHVAFWDATGQKATAEVLLDGYGKPLDTSYTAAGQTATVNPYALPSQVKLDVMPKAVFLKYRTKRTTAVAAIFN